MNTHTDMNIVLFGGGLETLDEERLGFGFGQGERLLW